MNTKDKGELSEAKVIARLKEKQLAVLVPFGDNQKYDLAYESDNRIRKVQVKTGRLINGAISFNLYTATSNTKENKSKQYSKKDIDEFMVYCPGTDSVYKVPIEETPNTEMRLRVEKTKCNRKKAINWAKNYLF